MTVTYETLLTQERPGVLSFGGARMTLLDVEAGFWALRRQMETLVGPRLADDVLQQAGANGGASFARAFAGEGTADASVQPLRDCIAAYQAAGFGQFEIVESQWPLGRVLIRAQDAFEAWTARQHGDRAGAPVCAYTAGVLVGFVNVVAGRRDVVCVQRACQAEGAEACLFELLPADAAGDARMVAFDPDPALGRQLNLLELLFDRMPMGIAIFDREYRIRRYNPTWAEFADLYAPPSAAPIAPGAYYFDFLPGTEPTVLPLFERALAGETVRLESVRLESEGIVTYWDVVLAPITVDGEVTGILNATIDATERVRAHQKLETTLDTLRQREERLSLVLEGINDGIWDWDMETDEVYFSPRWKSMLGYAEDEVQNEFASWENLIHPDDRERATAALQEHLDGRMPFYRLEHRLRHKDGGYRWILARGKALRRDDGTPYRLLGSHTDVTERRLAEEALHYRVAFENVVSTISADFINMPLDEIDQGIQQALKTIGRFTGVDRSYLFRFSEDRAWMSCSHEWSAPGVEPQIEQMQDVPVDRFAWSNRCLLDGESLHVPRVADLPPEAEAERREFERQDIRSLVAVPMVYRGSTIGFVGFDSVREEKAWPEDSIRLLGLVAAVFANALEHQRAQAIQAGLRQFLELLATGGGFSETLHTLVRIIEEQWPGMLGLVLLLDEDGRHLHIGASVSLPKDYVQSIEGLEIGPLVGSCGTASYRGERVIVEDIDTDPRWDGLRSLAQEHGLRACWSEPVLSPEDDVVGTFAMYYRRPRAPTEAELRTIEMAAHLVGIAIEHKQAQEALQESQRRMTTLISNLPGMAYRCRNDTDWTMEFVSEGALELTGYPPHELIGNKELSYGNLIHPDDRDRVWHKVQAALEEDQPFQLTYRLTTPHGEKWVWEQGRGVAAPTGNVIALEGFATDITERVMAQRHLEQRVAERTHQLSTLLEVSHNVNSTLDLGSLLDLILDQLRTVVEYTGASILTLEEGHLSVQAYRGPIPQDQALSLRFPLEEARVNRQVIQQREPLVISDVRGDTSLARMFRQTAGNEVESVFGYVRSWLGVPLTVKGEVLGMLTLDHSQPGFFAAPRTDLVLTFANQVAVALENARLYAQAEESAVAAERSRLARDLHDAVTQTLFSSSLIAEVLPRLWERDPAEARRRLDELRELTRGALAEMRTLLLELRPSALEEAKLADLLRQLAESITGRARVPVTLELAGECHLEPEVKIALYRITQEALNNVAKHAGASAATLRLHCQPGQVELQVHDDGLGFDPANLSPNSLGLNIMRERAETIGAALTIESQPMAGTQITVSWRSSNQ
ncbi:MAG: PAS domain-containing protein [Anaerolineae bacterium]|jgi:two-component system nitrate/nitrite sensor histidine kinase NarX